MKREDVDRILDSIKGNKPTARASIMSGRLAELCRRWLAVEDAPAGWVSGADMESAMQTVVMDKWPGSVRCGNDARVRIVPEDGQGVKGGR